MFAPPFTTDFPTLLFIYLFITEQILFSYFFLITAENTMEVMRVNSS